METLCPKCQKKYKVPDSLAGKQVRCKNEACRQVFTLAAPAASAPVAIAPVASAPVASAPAAAPTPPKPAPLAGDGQRLSSLLDDLPPLPLDGLPQAEGPAVVLTNYKAPQPKKKSFLASLFGGSKKGSNSFALKLGGGIVAVLVVGGLVWAMVSLLSGGDVPAWTSYYVPENAQLIAYANVDELRNSSLYADIQKLVDKRAMQIQGDFDIDDVSEVFLAGTGFGANDEPLTVIRMKKDHPLKDLLPKELRERQTQTYRNVEYMGLGRSWDGKEKVLAKTGDCTFCFAPTEDILKQAIQRLDRKERVKLDKNLQAALDAVAGSNLYAAGINLKNPRISADMFHVRASITSSVWIEATVVFANVDDATNCKKEIDKSIADLTKALARIPSEQRKEIEPLLSGVRISQDGRELCCDVKWRNEDIVVLVKKAKETRSPFPGMPR